MTLIKNNALFKYSLTGILGIGTFVFWAFFAKEVQFFKEFFQMFLPGYEYFAEKISRPEGFANYLSVFLTQFYYYPLLGGAILAILAVIFQILVNKSFEILNVNKSLYVLTFVPVLLTGYFYCKESTTLSLPISLIFSLLAFYVIEKFIKDGKAKNISIFLILSCFYWLFGVSTFVAATLFMAKHFKANKILAISYLAYILAFAGLLSFFVMLPVDTFFTGCFYDMYITINHEYYYALIVSALLPIAASFVKKEFSEKIQCALAIIIIALGIFLVPKSLTKDSYQSLRLFMYCYHQEWDKIIEDAQKHNPRNTYGIQCLNLALAQKGILADSMFNYLQPGIEGLASEFQTDIFSPAVGSEVFWHLGAVNISQRFAFESQENIPNFEESSKLHLRLAETNIMNKQYAVASKYLERLSKTLFYKKTAKYYLSLIRTDKTLEEPKFAEMNSKKLERDGIQMEVKIANLNRDLLEKNINNKIALQYFQATALLNMNYNDLKESTTLVAKSGGTQLPKHVQEGLYMFYINENGSDQNIPNGISDETKFNYKNKKIDNTYWKYIAYKQSK